MIVNLHWQQESGFWLLTDHTFLRLLSTGMPTVEALETICIVSAGAFVRHRLPMTVEVEPQ
jgi:hypothetical protein